MYIVQVNIPDTQREERRTWKEETVEGLYYSISRIPECLSLRPNWLTPSPHIECVPPPLGTKGGGEHSLAGEGRGEPISTTGEKAWHSVGETIAVVLADW